MNQQIQHQPLFSRSLYLSGKSDLLFSVFLSEISVFICHRILWTRDSNELQQNFSKFVFGSSDSYYSSQIILKISLTKNESRLLFLCSKVNLQLPKAYMCVGRGFYGPINHSIKFHNKEMFIVHSEGPLSGGNNIRFSTFCCQNIPISNVFIHFRLYRNVKSALVYVILEMVEYKIFIFPFSDSGSVKRIVEAPVCSELNSVSK